MNFKIMSRGAALNYSELEHSDKSVIISIHSSLDCPPHFYERDFEFNGIQDVLFLEFDDVEANCDLKSFKVISEDDAREIVDFVVNWSEKVDTVIVHCDAGVSRSAGVCAAISKYMTGSDDWVFDSPRYQPNMTCYRTVLNGFYEVV